MTFKDSEGVRFLADHIKSIWALSAGGIAFGSGLLGFVSRDVRIPRYGYLVCFGFVFAGLCSYAFSVMKGIRAHQKLTGAVFKSEQDNLGDKDLDKILGTILDLYDCSKYAFLVGCFALGLGVFGFVVWNTLATTSKPNYLTISLKNATVDTQDSRRVEIEELSFKITDLRSLP